MPVLDQVKAMRLLRKYAIPFPRTWILRSAKLPRVVFPCVLKVDSPRASHKTERALVQVNIHSERELRRAVRLMENKAAGLGSFRLIVQEQLSGFELIVGMKRDQTFGPVILFGLGGVLVELIGDVAMRVAPLTRRDCLELVSSGRAGSLLAGFRGNAAVDKSAVADLLLSVSRLAMAESDIVELDCNPVIAREKEVFVVDARFVA